MYSIRKALTFSRISRHSGYFALSHYQNCRLKMSGSGDYDAGSTEARKAKTAGLIIIGDEILKGQVTDTNSCYLCKELYKIGIKVGKISVISDGIETIATEVRTFSYNYDYVFTTGGIGPTHDDMTYLGVAKAFDDEVKLNPVMANMIREWLGSKGYSEEVTMRMGLMPSKAQLVFDPTKERSFPVAIVNNVYIFPGVPRFLRALFPRILPMLASNPIYFREIYITHDELSVTPHLDVTVAKYSDTVVFGSYPVVDNVYFFTRITMESHIDGEVEKAQQFLSQLLPHNSVISYDPQPIENAPEKVYAIIDDAEHPLHNAVKMAVDRIEEALERYGFSQVVVCFNGGKDCTALLHLFFAVLKKKYPHEEKKLNTLCITIDDSFQEMDEFINATIERYNLQLWQYASPIKDGLSAALKEHPEIKAVLMGTRNGDPHALNLNYFQMTDPSWPQVMRVSPLLEWSYEEVWQFLRSLSVPYCSLYNSGLEGICKHFFSVAWKHIEW